jgi:hypothetical protein
MRGSRSAPGGLFADADFDYEARIALGAAATGIGDVGLVLATLDLITDGDPQTWFDAWTERAADLAGRGDAALKRGHPQTASWAFLAAAEYYAKALVFVDGLADQSVLMPTFRAGRGCWEKVVDASQGCFVRLEVPYEATTLPGYLLRPDDTGAARPTLVMVNGSDASLPGLLGKGGSEALRRGWNVFVFDGPGLGGRADAGHRCAGRTARRGSVGADRVRHQPGWLLDHPGGRVRAPDGRGGR